MKQNQSIKGNHNTQVAGDFTKYEIHIHNPVFNIVNSYSDIKTFEKVLFSIPFERFSDEVVKPYLEHHTKPAQIDEINKVISYHIKNLTK